MARPPVAAGLFAALLAVAPLPASPQQPCPAPSTVPKLKEENLFPGRKEIDLGEVIAEQVQRDFRVMDDDALNSYLNEVAGRILAAFPGERSHIEVRLIDKPYLNAFTMPGGRVYVMRKLVAFLRSESELAGMLSHEMGHELSHQPAVEFSYIFHRVLGITEVGDRRDIFEKYNRLVDNLGRDPKALAKLGEHEEPDQYQADQIALTAMANAGYDPQAFVDFFDRLAQTKGKTGSWLSDVFGTTSPNEKRLRIMKRALAELPPGCRAKPAGTSAQQFLEWQGVVLAYSGLGRRDSLRALQAKKTLSSPLRQELSRLRFSPDGRYLLAQDDSSIYVASREPLKTLFRIDAPGVASSDFTPDSKNIVFRTSGHRVEEWSVEDQERVAVKELTLPGGCLQARLSPDGKTYACYSAELKLSLLDVASGAAILEKQNFFEPVGLEAFYWLVGLTSHFWVHMGFSPDGHYFLASHHEDVLAYDLAARREVHVGAPLRYSLRGGFAFLEGGKIFGQQGTSNSDSILAHFPAGDAVARLKLPEFSMEGASHGDYLLLHHIKDAEMAIFDLSAKKVIMNSKKAVAADAFGDMFVSERASGEVGFYDHDVKFIRALELPNGPLPGLVADTVSPDLRWLAFSGPRRGAVWDLAHNERILFLRNFDAVWLDPSGGLYVDFPKQGDVERSIVRADLDTRRLTTVRTIAEEKPVVAMGDLRIYRKPAGGKQLDKNIILEVHHIRDDSLLWSRAFPHESPVLHVSQPGDSLVLAWALNTDSAKQEAKDNPALAAQVARLKDKGTSLLFSGMRASSGTPLGAVAVDTGKLSFNVRHAMVLGGHMILTDNANRTLLYSLATGEPEGKTFGRCRAASLEANALAADNEPGVLALFDLTSLEKRSELKFSYPISLVRFSADGRRLFVLTTNQTAYFFDLPELLRAPATTATH